MMTTILNKLWANFFLVAILAFGMGFTALALAPAKRSAPPPDKPKIVEVSSDQIYTVTGSKGDLEAIPVRVIPITKPPAPAAVVSPAVSSPPPAPPQQVASAPQQVASADPAPEASAEPPAIKRHWHEPSRYADRGSNLCARHGLHKVETGHGGWRCR